MTRCIVHMHNISVQYGECFITAVRKEKLIKYKSSAREFGYLGIFEGFFTMLR